MMAVTILVGAAVYILILAVLWLMAGRSAGAEADMLALVRRGRRRGEAV